MVKTAKKVNMFRLALRRGIKYRMELTDDDRLCGSGGGYFAWLAPVFDSMDQGGTWHRLRLAGVFENCKYEVLAAAADADLREEMEEGGLTFPQKAEILKQYSWIRRVNTDDMLLHELTGRYLWVMISVSGAAADSRFCLEGFQAEFPWQSFSDYLPEIYQEEGRNSFFERYMAALQSMYEDLEKEVDHIPEYLDYELTSEENLHAFSEWTGGWARDREFTSGQLREVIRNLQRIQSGRGTKSVMRDMVYLVTGREARIIEYFKWHDWMKKSKGLLEEYERLFGKREDTFTVLIDMADPGMEISEEKLRRFLEDFTPLGMCCNVVFLDWNSHMDTHCYLDQNSCLSVPEFGDAGGVVLSENYILG